MVAASRRDIAIVSHPALHLDRGLDATKGVNGLGDSHAAQRSERMRSRCQGSSRRTRYDTGQGVSRSAPGKTEASVPACSRPRFRSP
jgi:hypothetical protein